MRASIEVESTDKIGSYTPDAGRNYIYTRLGTIMGERGGDEAQFVEFDGGGFALLKGIEKIPGIVWLGETRVMVTTIPVTDGEVNLAERVE